MPSLSLSNLEILARLLVDLERAQVGALRYIIQFEDASYSTALREAPAESPVGSTRTCGVAATLGQYTRVQCT